MDFKETSHLYTQRYSKHEGNGKRHTRTEYKYTSIMDTRTRTEWIKKAKGKKTPKHFSPNLGRHLTKE